MADSRLDVTSKDFDPEACVAVSSIDDVQLPCPDAAELGNIKKCIALVPQAVRDEMEQELGGIVLKVLLLSAMHRYPDAALCDVMFAQKRGVCAAHCKLPKHRPCLSNT